MNIAGIGIIYTRGRGVESFAHALQQGWKAPQSIALQPLSDKPFPVYAINQELIMDKAVLGKMRRADRFSRMAALAAWDAVRDSGISLAGKDNTLSLGIILASAFGPHTTTFRFLDDILDYGEANVSPTAFSHSVHNAAASYIAALLDIRGPTITLSQFAFPFHQAILLAQAWLDETRCDYVLVGSADESGKVMEYICSQKLRIADDGQIQPFHFSVAPKAVPGEGSVFFLMTRREDGRKYGELSEVALSGHRNKEEDKPDICVLEADGMTGDETGYRDAVIPDSLIAGYSPLFGSMLTGSGFQCAAAALMLKEQIRYACPVQDNPGRVNICTVTEAAEIHSIHCIRYHCGQKKAVITLRR